MVGTMGKLVDSVLRMGRDGVDLGPCQEIRRSLPLPPSLSLILHISHKWQEGGDHHGGYRPLAFQRSAPPRKRSSLPVATGSPEGRLVGGLVMFLSSELIIFRAHYS